ncbi:MULTISPECIES: fumarylacetoacetate hydrolase family protein [unclassified Sphingobium]|uniref:fumarylacetoacetate hydrolase family protein n=1 Tax=unclassified Sphingobium TaxID=2611147 RepID=UPI000D159C24|nr:MULTISPECIES: fumarylacetoacetate hydrolase family protein [unclassified Sphingobium]MBG6120193.1 2-keto-4-pentenoate hydratase/2-oxohepta-3-ene-1,7-dioic acid hydratase in catechol pathway [Sphingobium sp. JAI105]PSO09857.1 5-carboxymethyl-2-hydroxymuconate isomerase [Sphingobium sp. AEW4]TWD00149.1 2-keto-4-pentenoate hydratase/2-oxohepta-3-ene-1,7-dioic acid hydratase in catechol pathway [Sphingobium sp. AEW010]TWD19216.1 2-keto-4-pentenoate hydratase/2-oxohepta-3-ene-1,7-dioic acid hydra
MKLVSYTQHRKAGYGILKDDGIVDAAKRLPDYPDLASLLADVTPLRHLADLPADMALADVTLLPPIPNSGRIVCIGLNYKSHIAETGSDTPQYPILFPRYPSSLVADGAPLIRPKLSERFDFEGELAVVIGRPGRHIAAESALDHVAGYACFNDGSIRDFQKHTSQFMAGKNFDRSGSFGPWLVTPDEAGDVNALQLRTTLNGEIVQQTGLNDLLFGVEALIAYMSQIWELQPGDVIATGTTGGVGARREPPLWMKPGDRVEVAIDRLGTLSNPIAQEEDAA